MQLIEGKRMSVAGKPLPRKRIKRLIGTAPQSAMQAFGQAVRDEGDVAGIRRGWIFTHPDSIRDILVTHDRCFTRSPSLRFVKFTLGNGLLTSEGVLHQRQRSLIQPVLHPKRLANYAGIMSRHTAEATATWRDGEPIDLHHEMTQLTLRIVAEALFGAAVGPEIDSISHAMDMNVAAFRRVIRPWGHLLAFIPTPFTIRYAFARNRLIKTLRTFVQQRRAQPIERDDLLSRLLAARDETGDSAMSERQLMDECVTLFAAGHETTANAMTYTLWLLSQHPEIEARLHEEVARVLGEKPLAAVEDLEALVYTRMVAAESMRLYPPAWIQARLALQECEIGGYRIPRKTIVFVSQWITHRDPRWWPEPERFNPMRFTDEARAARPRWAYFPFGGGSRLCVGEAFAWAEITLCLAMIVRVWHLEATTNQPPALEPGITLRPGSRIRMIARRRQASGPERPAHSLQDSTT